MNYSEIIFQLKQRYCVIPECKQTIFNKPPKIASLAQYLQNQICYKGKNLHILLTEPKTKQNKYLNLENCS